jgi:hypothetical protein
MQVEVTPVPVSATVCGLPGALSVTETVPFRLPEALGAKVTLIVQLAADARFEPLHVSVSPKSAVTAVPAMLRVVVP